jgi:hypothetical protein
MKQFGTTPARKRDIQKATNAYIQWLPQKEKPEPPRGVVWLSHYLIDYIVNYTEPGTLIWVTHEETRKALAERGLETVTPGREPSGKERTLVLSVASHGTGLNLQTWNRNLIVSPSPSGDIWEQLMGRTHRTGQRRDEVYFSVLTYHEKLKCSFTRAVENAKYLQSLTGQKQKLLTITEVDDTQAEK